MIRKALSKILRAIASLLLKFNRTKQFGKEMLSSADIGKASRATRLGKYEEAVSIYQGILERGGDTVGESIACKKLANYYRSGRVVAKDIDYAIKLEAKANGSFGEINRDT